MKYWRFARNTLSETKSKIYTPKRDDEHPRLSHMGVPPPGQRAKRVLGHRAKLGQCAKSRQGSRHQAIKKTRLN